ncbi:hypothetical protein QQF64_012567, partial [Cirrhinus molitorella]
MKKGCLQLNSTGIDGVLALKKEPNCRSWLQLVIMSVDNQCKLQVPQVIAWDFLSSRIKTTFSRTPQCHRKRLLSNTGKPAVRVTGLIMQPLVDILKWFGVEVSGRSVSVCLVLLFLSLLYWYSISPYSILERCGIKHPKPSPFFGNLMMFRDGFFKAQSDLIKKYGRICGYYIGRRATVIIADPDMLRQVMVKEFNKFPNRMTVRGITKPMSDSLIMLKGEQWKRVRSILTPTFSAAKMKEMVPLINTATETLLRNLKGHAESGNSFNIHKCFGCFTMDVIASVAFGTQVDSQNNPDDPFVHHASKFFAFNFFRPVMIFFMAFPFLLKPLAGLLPNKSRDEMNTFFIKCIQKMVKQRDDLPPEQRRRDFLQLMLDVRASNKHLSLEHFDVVSNADEQPCTDQGMDNGLENGPGQESTKRTQQKRMMTEDEVVGQSFIFLLAGYETSSNTLGFACYLLALNPECQKKLQEEVDEFFSRH